MLEIPVGDVGESKEKIFARCLGEIKELLRQDEYIRGSYPVLYDVVMNEDGICFTLSNKFRWTSVELEDKLKPILTLCTELGMINVSTEDMRPVTRFNSDGTVSPQDVIRKKYQISFVRQGIDRVISEERERVERIKNTDEPATNNLSTSR